MIDYENQQIPITTLSWAAIVFIIIIIIWVLQPVKIISLILSHQT